MYGTSSSYFGFLASDFLSATRSTADQHLKGAKGTRRDENTGDTNPTPTPQIQYDSKRRRRLAHDYIYPRIATDHSGSSNDAITPDSRRLNWLPYLYHERLHSHLGTHTTRQWTAHSPESSCLRHQARMLDMEVEVERLQMATECGMMEAGDNLMPTEGTQRHRNRLRGPF